MCSVAASRRAVERISFKCSLFLTFESSFNILRVNRVAVHEVESVFVIYESVAVVVHVSLSVDLRFILPKRILKVLVSVRNGAVEDSYDYARVASCESPCVLYAYVSARNRILIDASVIV